MEDSSALGAGERAGIARWWRVREGKVWTSVQWSEYEPRRSTTDLDKVAEDSVDLGGVGDDGENPHAVSTARTDEAGPCGGGALGVILDIRRCLGQRREAQEVGAALSGGAVARPRGGSCAR
jgi:hypothetical protein